MREVGKKWEITVSGPDFDPPVEKLPSSAELTVEMDEAVTDPRRLWWFFVMSNMRPTSSVVEMS